MGNKTFFRKAESGNMGYRDIFSDVFKRHTEEDTARTFIAGTALTTPGESEMLANWMKPYLFVRFFGLGALAILLLWIFYSVTGHELAVYMLLMFIPSLVPLTTLLMAWEMNIPRNISLYETLKMVVFGGVLSIFCTVLLATEVDLPAILAPAIEEPAKLLIVCLFLGRRKEKRCYILNGILIGFAVGTGFALMESIYYSFNAFILYGLLDGRGFALSVKIGVAQALVRMFAGVVGHGVYAALYGGAIAMVKGRDRLRVSHVLNPQVLIYFGAAFLLHALNNADLPFSDVFVLEVISVQCVCVVMPLGLLALLPLLRKGVNQIVAFSIQANGGLTNAVNAAQPQAWAGGGQAGMPQGAAVPMYGASQPARTTWCLFGISGEYAGRRIELTEGTALRFGRDPGRCTLVLNASPRVSGLHCEVRLAGGAPTVTDLNSSNGTYIGTKKIQPGVPTTVSESDMICLGDSTCGFRLARETGRGGW